MVFYDLKPANLCADALPSEHCRSQRAQRIEGCLINLSDETPPNFERGPLLQPQRSADCGEGGGAGPAAGRGLLSLLNSKK